VIPRRSRQLFRPWSAERNQSCGRHTVRLLHRVFQESNIAIWEQKERRGYIRIPPKQAEGQLRVIAKLSPCLLLGNIASFAAYRLLQRDSLLTQDWGRLLRQRTFCWISVCRPWDACCRWLNRPHSYEICGVTGLASNYKNGYQSIRLAVTAHVRHAETRYDELLARGHEKREAREQVEEEVFRVLAKLEDAPNSET
jgi:hypothetical protein